MNQAKILKVFVLRNDLNAILNRIERINSILKGNVLTAMYARFHYGEHVASRPNAERRAELLKEREQLKEWATEKKAEIQTILDSDKRQQSLEEVAEILKTYPIVGGAR